MRILVVSDSHGYSGNIEKAIKMLSPDKLIFLGDGLREIENLSYIYDNIDFHTVCGNCDLYADAPGADILDICGYRFFFFFFHLYRVKGGLETFTAAAKERGATFALYGHTHTAYTRYVDGMYIINPGSVSCPREGKPSCAYIDIIGKNILTNTVEL